MFVSFRRDIFLNHVHTNISIFQSPQQNEPDIEPLLFNTDLKGIIRPELKSKEDTLKVLFEMCLEFNIEIGI